MDGSGTGRGRVSRWPGDVRFLVFLAFACAWLYRWVDPSLTYLGAGLTSLPAFSPDPLFVREHWANPGGPLCYLSDWLSQLLYQPALGACVLTALAGAVAVPADRAATHLAGRRLAGFRYVLAVVCLALDGRYLHLLDWQLGWAVSLAAADAWVRLPCSRPVVRLPLLCAGLALLYYLAGGPVLIAAPVLVVGELRWPQTRCVAGLSVVWLAALPWLSTRVGFDRPLAAAYAALAIPRFAYDATGVSSYALSAALPAFVLLLAALASEAGRASRPPRRLPAVVPWLGLAVVLALLPRLGFDAVQRTRLELAAHAARGEWDAVLATADRLPVLAVSDIESYAVLMALAETGRMGDEMFRYVVQPHSLLRSTGARPPGAEPLGKERARYGLQLYNLDLELGCVNEAEHALHETIEVVGTYPRALLPMARVQVLKGRPDAARVFLRLAAAQPAARAEARALLARLDQDPTLAGDAQQAHLREVALATDSGDAGSVTRFLESLVAEHPHHRLAVEYLMGWYLLSDQLDKLVAALPDLPAFGRTELPRHYQEAVLCWEAMTGRRAELGPWRISWASREQFERLIEDLGCDRDEVPRMLAMGPRPPGFAADLFGGWLADSYYHYRLFGIAGVRR